MPAARLFLALGTVTALLLGAVVVPWMGWAAIALDVAVMIAGVIDYRRASRTSMLAERRFPPLLAQRTRVGVEVLITSRAHRVATVRAREALHPGLSRRGLRHELQLKPQEQVVWRYELTPRKRGEHVVAPLTARILGPWRLAWAQKELLPPRTVRVYPQIRWEGEVGRLLVLARRRELGRSPWRLRGMGSETYALREYLKGDPLSKIHWKATARHGHLVSREETWEQGARLVILLDCARTMASIADADDGAYASKLDYALATALALARVASGRGDRVTVVAFSDRIERVIPVRSGARGMRHAYEKLYDLPARLREPAYDLAAEEALSLSPRLATVMLLTSVVDLAASELLHDAMKRLERRHRSLLIHLEDPELAALALGAPRSSAEAFAKASSLEIVLENRRLARKLRREGVRVVTTAADRLTLDTLETYLSALRPGRSLRRAPVSHNRVVSPSGSTRAVG